MYESLGRTITTLPAELTRLVEPSWAEPFTRLVGGNIVVTAVLAASPERDVRHLAEFSHQPQYLAVSRTHPLAAKERVASAELVGVGGDFCGEPPTVRRCTRACAGPCARPPVRATALGPCGST